MADAAGSSGAGATTVRLYHGSNVTIEQPDVSFNTGFADLGKGFYLTDDHGAAQRRAASRARRTGEGTATVSVFDLDEACVPWVMWGAESPALPSGAPEGPFGLYFESSPAGVVAWANYIKACRRGATEVPGLGAPAIVRAWIATEEVEMVYSGMVPAEALAEFMDPAELIVQYCLLDQDVIARALTFVRTE